MIRTAVKLAVIILLTAINSCYYERKTNEDLQICFNKDGNIWIMDIDGSRKMQITHSGLDHFPSWSPDGKKILFHSNRGDNDEIYVINSDGSGLRQITDTVTPDSNIYPTWSSDGERIVFTGRRSGLNYALIIDTEGTIYYSFTVPLKNINFTTLSPDGNYLYLTETFGDLYRVNLLTNDVETYPGVKYSSISISPDGKTLACSYNSSQIYLVPTDNLTSFYPMFSQMHPCWTPDGETIVYLSADGNIWSTRKDGTEQKQLTFTNDCSSPCVKWKPR